MKSTPDIVTGEIDNSTLAYAMNGDKSNTPFIALPLNAQTSTIMHELGHAIQTTTTPSGSKKCGLEITIKGKMLKALNETINEYFTQQILASCGENLDIGKNTSRPAL